MGLPRRELAARPIIVHDLRGGLAHDLSADALLGAVNLQQWILLSIIRTRLIVLLSRRAILLH